MLNEIKEYEEYRDINTSEKPRVLYENFIKEEKTTGKWKWSGIRRILTILARYYLYTENDYLNPKNIAGGSIAEKRSLLREETKSKLQEWLSGPFSEFCISSEEKRQKHKDLKNYINELVKKKDSYWTNNSIYSFLRSPDINTRNANNYDTIIADAINQGPLRNLCLVLKETVFDNITYYHDEGKENIKHLNKVRKQDREKTFNKFLKYIASAIPSLYGYTDTSRFVNRTNIDLAYWTRYASLATSNHKTVFLYKNNPLIETDSTKKSRLNPDFVRSYEVQLMPMEDAVRNMKQDDFKDFAFFEDIGVGHMRRMN